MSDLERAVVYTPQEGDVVVIEVEHPISPDLAKAIKRQGEEAFGREVRVVVLHGARFAGVVREGAS